MPLRPAYLSGLGSAKIFKIIPAFKQIICVKTNRQLTRFPVHFHQNVWRKVVILFAAGLEQAEAQLYLDDVFRFRRVPHVPERGDLCGLGRRKMKEEVALLKALRAAGNEGGRLEENGQIVKEGQPLQAHVWVDGIIVCGRSVVCDRVLRNKEGKLVHFQWNLLMK